VLWETLEFTVGFRLAESMTDRELEAFEAFIDADDEHGASRWLLENFPDHRDVVQDSLGYILGALKIASKELD